MKMHTDQSPGDESTGTIREQYLESIADRPAPERRALETLVTIRQRTLDEFGVVA